MYSKTINFDNKIKKIKDNHSNVYMHDYNAYKQDKLTSILPEYRTELIKTDKINPILAESDHGASIYSDNGKKYFIKYGWYSNKDFNEIVNEALILKKVNNPHIPKLIAYTNNIENKLKIKDSVYSHEVSSRGISVSNVITGVIMLPLIDGITLKTFIKENKDISATINIFKQIVYLLYEMNATYKFTHYDLHTANIMIEILNHPKTIYYESLDTYITTSHYVWMIDFGYSYANIRDINNKKIGICSENGFVYKEQWWLHDIFKLFMFIYNSISPSNIENVLSDIEENVLLDTYIFNYIEIDEAIQRINNRIAEHENTYKLNLSSYLDNINNSYGNYNRLFKDIDEDDYDAIDDLYDKYIPNILNTIEDMAEYIVNAERERLNNLYYTSSYKKQRKLIEIIMSYFKIIINKKKSTLDGVIKFYSNNHIYNYYAIPFDVVDDAKNLKFLDFVQYVKEII